MMVQTAVVAVTLLACATARSSAQVLSGRVLEAGSDRPIAAAFVSVSSPGQSPLIAESDSAGVFQLTLPRPGWYALRVERLGYAAASMDTLEVGRGEIVEIAIRLSVTAVPLAPLMVVERRSSLGVRTDFQRRAGIRSPIGLRLVHHARVAGFHEPAHHERPCACASRRHAGRQWEAHPVMLSQGGCRPTLYLNGALLQLAAGESIDDLIDPATLEGIEVYRNRTELPFGFAGPRECGAIIFWTRTGEPTRGGFWRILTAGALVLGMVVLIVGN
jgi:hypothetical protein